MERDFGFVQDVCADLESGTITSIMVARQRIDITVAMTQMIRNIAVLYLKENIRKVAMLQNKIKVGQAMW